MVLIIDIIYSFKLVLSAKLTLDTIPEMNVLFLIMAFYARGLYRDQFPSNEEF